MESYEELMSNDENVIKFIEEFKKGFKDESDVISAFTFGNCYHFASILNDLFIGKIVYDPIQNHFAFSLCGLGKVYDINGEVKEGTWFVWDEYDKFDELDYDRVVRQCIYKLGE